MVAVLFLFVSLCLCWCFVYELVLCVGGVLLFGYCYCWLGCITLFLRMLLLHVFCSLFVLFVRSYGEFMAYIVCTLTVLFCAVVT